ncbi:Retrotransposon polyprotein [Penicillium alfredii]|uniref:Retrotransposon polyprotein n=1 Tax=Penicillium alfredii TaxID=1506179 RepID=A0A9W9EG89_9EURO|nr:Retrotransposon polyprotein [Penicillium alfredii]XP_056507710.1 Retrotransposon polyprotein [Penicillium alfredii]XP_056507711.1 Retrotransposon polyprotein [Penicillium alfredii]XP_056507712.1 Retrotransposon polyprotein [Penicillium alfredii]XP_056508356.1 Retrotransposon polyprotein [Penicillium alfredii]XP_056509055.1 Retrotransposon polyprotein [Penicillium alfredii]XP_056513274.1 Retrotransposon polyprotein [Penicillium alfredii]XP_056513275.1 Retrotransposon polyprotein [Penicilli
MNEFVDTVVRIDNRFYDRQREESELKQWRRNPGRGNGGRFQQRRNFGRRDNDPYGPKPMELDAARLPTEEQKRRKNNNLCFNCGKPGHRIKDCRSKRQEKPQQLNATQERRGAYDTTGTEKPEQGKPQRLYATQERDWEGPMIVDGSKPPGLYRDERMLSETDDEEFPEIDYEIIENSPQMIMPRN